MLSAPQPSGSPSSRLRPLDEDLWCVEDSLRLGPGIYFPVRMTVVRHSGGLWLHAPLAIDDALAAELAALGEVRDIVAPNAFHHYFLGAAGERYPAAKVYASAAVVPKQPRARVDVHLDRARAEPPWPGVLELHAIEGAPKLDETVFLHVPSATLITTDLLFNMHEAKGAMTSLVLRMAGAWRKPAQSRLIRQLTQDRGVARASVQRVAELDFGRVIMAHGDIIEGPESPTRLREALAWMLAETG